MSGTLLSGGRNRSALAQIEASPMPAYRRAMPRNRSTTWTFPGFGRDPELSAAPPAVAPPPSAPPSAPTPALAPAAPAPIFAPPPAAEGGGSQTAGALGSPSTGSLWGDVVGLSGLLGFDLAPHASIHQQQVQAALPGWEKASRSFDLAPHASIHQQQVEAALAGWGGSEKGSEDSNSAGLSTSTDNDGSKESGGFGGDFGGGEGEGEGGEGGGEGGGDGGGEGGGEGGGDGGGDGDGGGGDGGGWMRGGYTGAGPDGVVQPNQPAGTVHEGEVVIPAHRVAQIGVDPLMQLAGPGAQMGGGGALAGIQARGAGDDRSIQPFQSPANMAGPTPPMPGTGPSAGPTGDPRTIRPFQTPTAMNGPSPPFPAAGAPPQGGVQGAAPMPLQAPMGMDLAMAPMGAGEPPMEELSVPSFQSDGGMGGYGEGYDADEGGEGFDMAEPGDEFMHGIGPYLKDGEPNDPFKPDDESRGATGATAMNMLGQMPPHAQAAVLQALGADPMAASALLQVLGPSFRDLIAEALKASAPPPGAAGMGMGGAPAPMI